MQGKLVASHPDLSLANPTTLRPRPLAICTLGQADGNVCLSKQQAINARQLMHDLSQALCITKLLMQPEHVVVMVGKFDPGAWGPERAEDNAPTTAAMKPFASLQGEAPD